MIYKYFKECKKLIVLITLLGMLIGMLFFITKDTPPTGKGPRDFNIIDDRYIVVASQEEDRLELYTFNEEKEEIKPTGNTLGIIQPVCVAL